MFHIPHTLILIPSRAGYGIRYGVRKRVCTTRVWCKAYPPLCSFFLVFYHFTIPWAQGMESIPSGGGYTYPHTHTRVHTRVWNIQGTYGVLSVYVAVAILVVIHYPGHYC